MSTNNVRDHLGWLKDIQQAFGTPVNFPIIDDSSLHISQLYGMLDKDKLNAGGIPLTIRSVFFIDPKKKIRAIISYPIPVGRNFNEIKRVLQALQLGDKHKIATPADWKVGEDVIVRVDVSDEEAKESFPGYKKVLPYLRYTNGMPQ